MKRPSGRELEVPRRVIISFTMRRIWRGTLISNALVLIRSFPLPNPMVRAIASSLRSGLVISPSSGVLVGLVWIRLLSWVRSWSVI